MTAIANRRPALPGNRLRRALAGLALVGLPAKSQVGSLRATLDKPAFFDVNCTFSASTAPEVFAVRDLQLPPADITGVVFKEDLGSAQARDRAMAPSQKKGHVAFPPGHRRRRLLRDAFELLLPILLPPPPNQAESVFGDIAVPHPLYKFQQAGIEFLRDTKPGALLADDMGLGKTVQAIVALRLLFRRGHARRALVVAPNSVITSWQRHFQEWAPELLTYRVQGSPYERRAWWDAYAEHRFHVGIIPYQSFKNDAQNGLPPDVDVLIADEAQNVKNPRTQQSRALAEQKAGRRWALTGTPLENSLPEFAALLRFTDRKALPDSSEAREIESAARRLMLRRRKEDVLDDLPEITSHIEHIELTEQQQREYDRAEREGVTELHGKPRNLANVLALITSLKQICNSFNGYSAKTEWLRDYVQEAVAEGDKVLVFSQYLPPLNDLERELAGFQPLKYVGALSQRQRNRVVDDFQGGDSRHQLMLLQVKAGGLGLTLTAANRVIHFDSWWNPAVQAQATARAHRIGQEKTVFETTLVSVDTIEERIQLLLEDKRELFERAVNDLSVDGVSRLLSQDELYSLFDDVGAPPDA